MITLDRISFMSIGLAIAFSIGCAAPADETEPVDVVAEETPEAEENVDETSSAVVARGIGGCGMLGGGFVSGAAFGIGTGFVGGTGLGVAAPLGVGLAAPLGIGVAAPLGVGLAAPIGIGVAAPLGFGFGCL